MTFRIPHKALEKMPINVGVPLALALAALGGEMCEPCETCGATVRVRLADDWRGLVQTHDGYASPFSIRFSDLAIKAKGDFEDDEREWYAWAHGERWEL